MNNTICFVAGKSGGHILPALSLAKEYQELHPNSSIIFFTTDSPLDQMLLKNELSIKHISLHLGNIPKNIFLYPWYGLQIIGTCIKSLYILIKTKPKKIISMGGYISLPVCIAAALLKIPIELFELNATPGKAVKTLKSLATTIWYCFPGTQNYLPKEKTHFLPYPIKFKDSDKIVPEEALRRLNFNPYRKTILILGGSQGSHFLNEQIKKWIESNPSSIESLQIIHQTGKQSFNWQQWYAHQNIPAHVFTYEHDMRNYYNAADLVICRAGAGTLFEVIFFNKRCIVIPLQTKTTDHQCANADALAQQYPELMTVLLQDEIEKNPAVLNNVINNFMTYFPSGQSSGFSPSAKT